MELPGWNSIQTTENLANFFFYASIGALVLLGLAEVFSHQYGRRHDHLVSEEQQAIRNASDGEIARLHRDTAALTADAEKSRAAIADANARALEAQSALEKFRAPRSLSPKLKARIATEMKSFAGTYFIVSVVDDPESFALATQIRDALESAGWNQRPWPGGTSPLVPTTPYIGFNHLEGIFLQSDSMNVDKFHAAIDALAHALSSEGLAVKVQHRTVPEITGMGNPVGRQSLIIQIGAKPR